MADPVATPAPWQIFAVKYAERPSAMKHEHFIFKDAHDGPAPMDYYIWAIRNDEGRVIVVDMGFDEEEAKKRKRAILRSPAEGLAAIGIDAAEVEELVVSHMHYDHCGNGHQFPKATFYVQEREMAFATGKHMKQRVFRYAYTVDYVVDLIRALYGDRVEFVDGMMELAPGITLHHVGGHTDGMQIIRVWTARGWVVLAADATHLYANMTERNPFPLVFNVADMLAGYETIEKLADSPKHIVPGHDPLVMARFPAAEGAEGIAVRVDLEPHAWD
jgi:glyoxylase-like metal-dependent hydrolase (beta-lactamase superfamily II)